ncbi:MAG: hypothetical protein RUDDFDWM_000438 [Candidatus Fervidibacterota bacterium]
MRACMAIDLGTSSCKVAIVDEHLNIRALASSHFETHYPKPLFAEQDPSEWWRAVCDATKDALASAGDVKIEVISLSSQREGLVLLDENFEPLRRAIVWVDRRANFELCELLNEFGVDWLSQVVGVIPSAGFTAPLLCWVRRHEPEVFQKAKFITQPKGFLIARMTDSFAIDITLAPRFSLFDMRTMKYSDELLSWVGVSEQQLPKVVKPNEVVGFLSREAASQLGLADGIPVVAGMGDRQCEVLGLALEPMVEVMVASGTAANISVLVDTDVDSLGLDARVARGPNIGNLKQLELGIWACGAALNWLARELLGIQVAHERASDVIEGELGKSTNASSLIVLPFFAGAGAPHWDHDVLACIIGLTLGHSKSDIVRATLEALAVEVAENVELYRRAIGTLKRVVHCGGLAQMRSFNQAIADATEMEVQLPTSHDAAVLGAACIGLSMLTGEDEFRVATKLNPRREAVTCNDEGVKQMRLRAQLQRNAYSAIASLMREAHRILLEWQSKDA